MSDSLKRNNNLLPIVLVVIAFILLCFGLTAKNTNTNTEQSEKTQHQDYPSESSVNEQDRTLKTVPLDYQNLQMLTVNPPQEYNYMTKKAIYDIRKKYVASSIFYHPDYRPSEEVFGQIVDGKPWWGLDNFACHKGDNSYGVSAVSRFVNNPNLLIAPMMIYGFRRTEGREHFCNANYTKYLPTAVYYNPQNKMIFAKYNLHREVIDNPELFGGMNESYFLSLIGMNARDLGYEYISISYLQNISMLRENNAKFNVYQLHDFIHLGSSCNIADGCNNISPHQPELDFYFTDLPAVIEIKLWKTKPQDANQHEDFTYQIIFEETDE